MLRPNGRLWGQDAIPQCAKRCLGAGRFVIHLTESLIVLRLFPVVVLATVMIGTMPWDAPRLSDPRFAAFIRSPQTYFRSTYGVSKEAQQLLSRVLEYDPALRMGLAVFRQELLALPHFFATRKLVHVLFGVWPTVTSTASNEGALDYYDRFWEQRSMRHYESGGGCSPANQGTRFQEEIIVPPRGIYAAQWSLHHASPLPSQRLRSPPHGNHCDPPSPECLGCTSGLGQTDILHVNATDVGDALLTAMSTSTSGTLLVKPRRKSILDIFRPTAVVC